VRINIPTLTEERRKELTKVVGKYSEEAKIQIRNVRREANDQLKKLEKSSEITEDELKSSEEKVQKSTDAYIDEVDKLSETKESDEKKRNTKKTKKKNRKKEKKKKK